MLFALAPVVRDNEEAIENTEGQRRHGEEVHRRHGFWLDEDQRTFPFRPEPPQYHPEQPIRRSETGLRVPLLQGSELLPQGQIFQEQIATRTNGLGSQFEQEPQQT